VLYKRKKIISILGALIAVSLVIFSIWYYQLSNRHKAIVKTKLLHTFHIIDPDWDIAYGETSVTLKTPEMLLDGIYQSMDGPQAIINFNVNPKGSSYKWITGFKTEAFRKGDIKHNNDYLCHTNIDFYDALHYKNLNIPRRFNQQYPRLGTLSNGINSIDFPEGFGFPVAKDESFLIGSRTLNHNIQDAFFKVNHEIEFMTAPASEKLKPLVPKSLVLLQNYNHDDPDSPETSSDPNICLPLDLKNHVYPNEKGVQYASHWLLPQGKHQYEFEVTYQLNLSEDTKVHTMAAHLHPHAELFTLYDITADAPVYTFNCTNYEEKIGLKNVPVYSDTAGLQLYKDHKYKLVLVTQNPSENFRDMMAVLILYLYDAEMDTHLNGVTSR